MYHNYFHRYHLCYFTKMFFAENLSTAPSIYIASFYPSLAFLLLLYSYKKDATLIKEGDDRSVNKL